MTLKNRTISPVAQLFLDYVREVVKPPLQRNSRPTGSATAREFRGRKSSSDRV